MEENGIVITEKDIYNLKDIIKNNSIFIIGVGASLIILGVCAEIDNRKSKGVC